MSQPSASALKRAARCKDVAVKLASADPPDHLRIIRFLKKAISLNATDPDLAPLLAHHESALEGLLAPAIPSSYASTSSDASDAPADIGPPVVSHPRKKQLEYVYSHLAPLRRSRTFSAPSPQRVPRPDCAYSLSSCLYESSLEDLGYSLTEVVEEGKKDWVLRRLDTEEEEGESETESNLKFKWVNQDHYDWIGTHVASKVQELLKSEFGLEETRIGSEGQIVTETTTKHPLLDPDHVSVFHSPGLFQTPSTKPLLLLVQGSGVVRAGVWGMRICVNESLRRGTMFNYVERAQALDWDVLILNPNDNYVYVEMEGEGEDQQLQQQQQGGRKTFQILPKSGHRDPYEHSKTVLDALFNSSSSPSHLLIVAHSFGGSVVLEDLFLTRPNLVPLVSGLALTDSVHQPILVDRLSRPTQSFLLLNSRQWVRSEALPLNHKILAQGLSTERDQNKNQTSGLVIERRSAGTEHHDETSQTSVDCVFEFLQVCHECHGLAKDVPVECFRRAELLKEAGNDCIRASDVEGAKKKYLMAIAILTERLAMYRDSIIEGFDDDGEEEENSSVPPDDFPQQIETLVRALRSNMGLVELRLGHYQDVITYTSLVLAVEKRNFKNLKRRGLAYMQLKNFDKAKISLTDAVGINPQDKQAKQYLAMTRRALKAREQAQRKAYGRLFQQ